MVDRILHIGHKFSNSYNKDLLQRAAEVAIYKGPAAVAPHLAGVEKLNVAEAQDLAQKINAELLTVNRSVLLQYGVMLLPFLTIAVFSLNTRSYIFGSFFALPACLLLYSMIKFIRRNKLK